MWPVTNQIAPFCTSMTIALYMKWLIMCLFRLVLFVWYWQTVSSFNSCVTHLLRNLNGNSPFPADSDGYTPLHYAASHGHKMAVQIVRQPGSVCRMCPILVSIAFPCTTSPYMYSVRAYRALVVCQYNVLWIANKFLFQPSVAGLCCWW